MVILPKKRNVLPRYCLGELLLESGVITRAVLNNTVATAQKTQSKLGRVMVMSGHLSELDVECALKVQKSIRDGSLYMNLAKELLQFAHSHQVSLNEAYQYENVRRQWGFVSRLGKLVLGAGIVAEVELSKAMHYSLQTSYPLGQSLVHLELISDTTLITCLNLQVLVRDGHLSFLDSVRALRHIVLEGETFESLLFALNLRENEQQSVPKLGELLVAAKLLSQNDSIIVTELGIEKNVQFGDLLLSYGLVSETEIDAAVQLQNMFANCSFTMERASRLLKIVHTKKTPLAQILTDFNAINQAVNLLQATHLFGDQTSESPEVCDLEIAVAEMLLLDQAGQVENVRKAVATICQLQKVVTTYEESQQLICQKTEQEKDKVASKSPTLNRLPAITNEPPLLSVTYRTLDQLNPEDTAPELLAEAYETPAYVDYEVTQSEDYSSDSELETGSYESSADLISEEHYDYAQLETETEVGEEVVQIENVIDYVDSIDDVQSDEVALEEQEEEKEAVVSDTAGDDDDVCRYVKNERATEESMPRTDSQNDEINAEDMQDEDSSNANEKEKVGGCSAWY
ncbi:MAG: hypothetical protein SGJ27_11505 [Candidatus Melainabacteria bacterium]|nr:hypothetical protein [Candidatus Melainabacteria bacterium]